MTLKKATTSDVIPLQAICRDAYAQIFADHWTHDGLELYLEQEFGTPRLRRELASDDVEYYFIHSGPEPVGFL